MSRENHLGKTRVQVLSSFPTFPYRVKRQCPSFAVTAGLGAVGHLSSGIPGHDLMKNSVQHPTRTGKKTSKRCTFFLWVPNFIVNYFSMAKRGGNLDLYSLGTDTEKGSWPMSDTLLPLHSPAFTAQFRELKKKNLHAIIRFHLCIRFPLPIPRLRTELHTDIPALEQIMTREMVCPGACTYHQRSCSYFTV